MSNSVLDSIENRLEEIIESSGAPEKLKKAMKHSLMGAGKRVRPVLAAAFCEACGGTTDDVLDGACAVELVHTYSLIHDDLPCMDDDDMRRGKPSCHKAFGEDTALLAGDALLTLAFKTILGSGMNNACEAGYELAVLSGAQGMVGGQVYDLEAEGKRIQLSALRQIHSFKTCKLIEAACVIGCLAANRNDVVPSARDYANNLGMAFQIIDDILDVCGDEKTLGKPIGSDAENEKNTYVSLLGLEESRRLAREYTDKACESLCELADKADYLRNYALRLLSRVN